MPAMPGVRFLPNAITVLALCSGLTSVAFALNGQWLLAVGAIATAAILDSLDGPAARLLGSTSRIGAELDSLSDCISFGVAPALIMYVWLLREEARGFGWVVCLLFAVCAALRLARFNSLLEDTPKPWAKGFFTGIPTPAGGLLVTAPLLLTVRLGDGGFWASPWVVSLWVVFIGLMMVSRVPSIALKSVRMPPQHDGAGAGAAGARRGRAVRRARAGHRRRHGGLPAAPAVRRVEVQPPEEPPRAVAAGRPAPGPAVHPADPAPDAPPATARRPAAGRFAGARDGPAAAAERYGRRRGLSRRRLP